MIKKLKPETKSIIREQIQRLFAAGGGIPKEDADALFDRCMRLEDNPDKIDGAFALIAYICKVIEETDFRDLNLATGARLH